MLQKFLNFLKITFKKTPLDTNVVTYANEEHEIMMTDDVPPHYATQSVIEEKKKRGRKKKTDVIE